MGVSLWSWVGPVISVISVLSALLVAYAVSTTVENVHRTYRMVCKIHDHLGLDEEWDDE